MKLESLLVLSAYLLWMVIEESILLVFLVLLQLFAGQFPCLENSSYGFSALVFKHTGPVTRYSINLHGVRDGEITEWSMGFSEAQHQEGSASTEAPA